MAFQQGLSGLNAAARNLDVIGNNIANAGTVGFKMSRAEFADIYATSLTGAVGLQVGIGTQVGDVSQQFTQGNVTVTSNPLDLAISGNGFYRMDQNGVISYQRNGQFQLDKDGNIVNNSGQKLTGYQAVNGAIIPGVLTNLQISTADLPPGATTTASMVANLDATKTAPTVAFNPTVTASYNDTTAFTVYDSLGNSHSLSLYFVKTAANTWDAYMTVDGTSVPPLSGPPSVPATDRLTQLTFSTSGALTAGGTPTSTAFTPAGAAALAIAFDFAGTSQFGSAFGVTTIAQDGFASGKLAGLSVGETGVISGRYTNGKAQDLGQVALAAFANTQGLTAIGNNQWVETADSGQPLIDKPGSGTLGLLQSGAVEDANVDLTQELVNLIVAQRAYQANAQTVRAQDQILQTLVNLR